MKPVKNNVPEYAILHPIGSILRWVSSDKVWEETITVRGYTQNCSDCGDCDRMRYIDEKGQAHCHYRKAEAFYGLRY